MDRSGLIITLVVVACKSYIIPNDEEHACRAVECENGGTLLNETCTCECDLQFSGILCEIELTKSDWPANEFSLPMSFFGCPEGTESGWTNGYINLTISATAPVHVWNDRSPIYSKPNILGPFFKHSIQFNFCVKRLLPNVNTDAQLQWGSGKYCILKSGNVCPDGFDQGAITIEGYTLDAHDVAGTLPDVDISNSSVTLKFCCREDGDVAMPMTLPSAFPYNLFIGPSSLECQEIKNMLVQKDIFYMTDNDGSWSFSGSFPTIDNSSYARRIGLPFCYYTPYQRRECYFKSDNGNSYNGRMNTSATGKPCLTWANVSSYYVNSKTWYGEFEQNYCRSYEDYGRSSVTPTCFVNVDRPEEKCKIAVCNDDDPDMRTFGAHKPYYNVDGKNPEFAVDGLLTYGETFLANRPVLKPWYQVDLQEHIKVYAIQTARYKRWFPNTLRFIGTYVSNHQWDFLNYGAFRCDDLRFPRKSLSFRFQCKRPIVGQFISLRDFDHMSPKGNPWRYFVLSLQEVMVIGKKTNCGRPLGMITGNIYSYQIDSSSVLINGDIKYISYKGRLLNAGIGWCSHSKDNKPWFSVDLITPRKVQGVLLQGWYEGQSQRFIKRFTISYGVRRDKLKQLEDPLGTIKVFRIDPAMAASAIQRFLFSNEIMARWIQINPITEIGESSCLKMEVIGCHQQAKRDLFCQKGSIDYGFATQRYVSWWLETTDDVRNVHFIARDNTTLTSCNQLCLKYNCTSYYLSPDSSLLSSCNLHIGHRFKPNYYRWWLQDMHFSSVSSHRLCFKEFVPIDSCSQTVNVSRNNTTIIFSPGAPLMYEQGLNCTWTIITDNDQYIKLEIVHINMAQTVSATTLKQNGFYDVNPGTCKDKLKITDRMKEQEIVIDDDNEMRYLDSILISSTNTLFMNFMSCFQASQQEQNYFQIKVTTSDLPGCGMVGNSYAVKCDLRTAYIANNRFPTKNPEGGSRVWSIEGSYGQYVEFEFINLDLIDADGTCGKSFVDLYDTDLKGDESLIGRYCEGNRPYGKILSRWQIMRIEFRSESSDSGRGFLGKYTLIDQSKAIENSSGLDCGSDWYEGMNNCYKMVNANQDESPIPTQLTWVASEKMCQVQGGHLVSINNPNEMKTIHRLLTTVWNITDDVEFYIGLQKEIEETKLSSFSWTDGSPLTYTSWYQDKTTGIAQPDGFINERCTSLSLQSIHMTDTWNDIACAYDQIYSYICEKTAYKIKTEDMHDQLQDKYIIQNETRNGHFICNNSQLIGKAFVCDGKNDCGDESDERRCDTGCTWNQFRCNDNKCISAALYCDFIPHCEDSSDEFHCIRPLCSENEWQCSNEQCIPKENRCDLQLNCIDGSDENNCENCDTIGFQCYDQRCIPRSMVCDGHVDCSGRFSEDEKEDCQRFVQSSCTEWWSLGRRTNGEYLINFGRRDVSPALVECEFIEQNKTLSVITKIHHQNEDMMNDKFSDLQTDLTYKVDDKLLAALKEAAVCTQSIRLQCVMTKAHDDIRWVANTGEIIKLRSYSTECSCPFVNKCEAGKNVCNCNTTVATWANLENNVKLEDKGVIQNENHLPIRKVYALENSDIDEWFEIEIGSLECIETLIIQSSNFLCRSGVTISNSMICLLDYDRYGEIMGCRDLSHLDNCDSFVCPLGFVKCKDSFCIPIRLMCDGTVNCASGEDEIYCENVTCPGLLKCKGSNICLESNKVCDGFKDCPFFDDELLCFEHCPSNCTCDDLSVRCIGAKTSANIRNVSVNVRKLDLHSSDFSITLPEFNTMPLLAELNISLCNIKKIQPQHFRFLHNLLVLDLRFNHITTLVANTFYGLLNLRQLLLGGNFRLFHIEPRAFLGLTTLPTLEITQTELKHIHVNAFDGLINTKELDLKHNAIKKIDNHAFRSLSSLRELNLKGNRIEDFSSKIFSGLSALEKLDTDAYVFCCLKPSTVSSYNCFPQEDEFSSCTDLMRNDVLRWFLWIIGICALVGNLGVLMYRFVFATQSLKKGHGVLIANLGISDMCMGIYLLIIASADTYFSGRYIWNDLSWRRGGLCKFAGIMSTVSSECSVLFLCLITVDRMLAVKFPFGQYCFTQKKAICAAVVVWISMIVLAVTPLFPSSYFNDEFYSRSAVCLALPLTRDKPSGWEYGATIFIVFNFVIFVLIAFGQILIYKEVAFAVDAKIRIQRKNQDMAIARSLFLVMFTDFICWFPIGVMGLMAFSDYRIPGEVYAWTAVFILPVNSALNPFLYTFSAIIKGQDDNKSRGPSRLRKAASESGISENIWTEAIECNKFIIGYQDQLFYTLADCMKNYALSIQEMTSVVKEIVSALAFLHERGMIHGQFQEEHIVLKCTDGRIDSIKTKASLREAVKSTELAEDMLAVGQLIRKLLRAYQSKQVAAK